MSALVQKVNSGPLMDVPVYADEPIVMPGGVAPVCLIYIIGVEGIQIADATLGGVCESIS